MILAIIVTVVKHLARGLASKLKLNILNAMLWGGVILLVIEHIWHGELVPWPPFLTAMKSPTEIPIMLQEISTIGTAMTLAVVGTWASIIGISRLFTSRIQTLKIKTHKNTIRT